MAELIATGTEPHDCWQKPLHDNEAMRLGRAPRQGGLKAGWDAKISREHAELTWTGKCLVVKCLDTARNPIYFNGQPAKEFTLTAGGMFRIGNTRFEVIDESEPIYRTLDGTFEDVSFSSDEVEQIAFRDTSRQMDLTAQLPRLIATSRNDEEFAMRLAALLLEALPRAGVAAVVRFDQIQDVELGQPSLMRWDTREEFDDRFLPSRRMISKAVTQNKSLLQIWGNDEPFNAEFTRFSHLDWAICVPIANDGFPAWCLYLSGESSDQITSHDLKGDLRFMVLMAQFIDSVRKVRKLEKSQANLSQFFSAHVLETLTDESAEILLKPKESDITVIFCDVRGFSKMTEKANDDLLPLLDRVIEALSAMTRQIVKYDGIISDFQGDAVLGFWGWPVALVDGPLPACQAALAIQAFFAQAALTPNHPLAGFCVGIGIGHGRAVAGRIGSDEQVKIGVFGPPVNLGSRLESLTKQLQVSILIDEPTAEVVRSSMPRTEGRCRRLGRVRPYGMLMSLMVSELLPPVEQHPLVTDRQIVEFETAVDAVGQGDWRRAREILESLPESDGPRNFLLAFLDGHGNTRPADWDGVIPLGKK